jgi:D-alanyl-D-alanine carboxypeptidase
MGMFSGLLRPAITGLALVTAAAAVPVASATAQDTDAALDRHALQRALHAVPAAGMPGAFAEVRERGWDWDGATGIADLSNARPTRPGMRHRVGSITKTFVATTALQLVGEGRLGLDDPVGRLLPDLLPADLGQQVTLRMLLNHTSGIGNYTNAMLTSLAAIERVRTTTYTPRQLVQFGLELPRTGPPGAAHSYSNTGYIIVGLLIQQATGNDPVDEVNRRIISPLRLTDTYFPGTEPAIRGPHAGAYFTSLGVRNLVEFNMSWAWLAGELVSTTEDLNDFFDALLGGRLLPADLLAQMRTTVPFDPAVPEAGGYGLGLYWLPTPCGQAWGHDGGVIGQITVSLHHANGRHVSLAMNLFGYQVPGELHPIDAAWQQFMVTGLCPGATASGAGNLMLVDATTLNK